MSISTMPKPSDIAAKAAERKAVREAAAARATLAEQELRKLQGTFHQFGRLTPTERKRLDAARRRLRQDGWAIGK